MPTTDHGGCDLIFSPAPTTDRGGYICPPQSNSTRPVIMENKPFDGIVIPVEADDFDDHLRNGPPYSFRLDPAAPEELRRQFSVTTVGGCLTWLNFRPCSITVAPVREKDVL